MRSIIKRIGLLAPFIAIFVLTGKGEQKRHDYLYGGFYEQWGKQAVLKDNCRRIRNMI